MSRQSDSVSATYASNLIRRTSAKQQTHALILPTNVIPAKAGISVSFMRIPQTKISAFAGMTSVRI